MGIQPTVDLAAAAAGAEADVTIVGIGGGVAKVGTIRGRAVIVP